MFSISVGIPYSLLRFFYPRMNQRGIILFDEYNDQWWPGCNLSVDEFLADKEEKLQLITRDNYQKFYIQKWVDTWRFHHIVLILHGPKSKRTSPD
jgi:hypothetical protein